MAEVERVAIFFDGSNLYHKLISLGVRNLLNFDYRGLALDLARERTLTSISYYVGVVRAKPGDSKAATIREKQIELFNHLHSKKQMIEVKKGYLMNTGGKFHEKGVDVQIAVDMLTGAYEDQYDSALLVSSDTDLIPAIKHIKKIGKAVEYVGFSHQPSHGLIAHASTSKLLSIHDLNKFIA